MKFTLVGSGLLSWWQNFPRKRQNPQARTRSPISEIKGRNKGEFCTRHSISEPAARLAPALRRGLLGADHEPCILPSLRCRYGPVITIPAGGGRCARNRARSGAPGTPAPSPSCLHFANAALRPVGARRICPAGARSARLGAGLAQPSSSGPRKLGQARPGRAPARVARPAAAVAALPAAGSVRPGARCARSLGRRQLRPFRVRGHRLHRSTACADAAGPTLHLVPGYAAARRRPLRLLAREEPALLRRSRSIRAAATPLRCALSLAARLRRAFGGQAYASRSALRSFVAPLRARAARSPCAGPSPRREPRHQPGRPSAASKRPDPGTASVPSLVTDARP